MSFEVEHRIRDDETALHIGSGVAPVYATPALLALVEETAWRSIANELAEGESTVGTQVQLAHLAPSLPGESVKAKLELLEHEGRRYRFAFEVWSKDQLIARGEHERFVVRTERFLEKARSALES